MRPEIRKYSRRKSGWRPLAAILFVVTVLLLVGAVVGLRPDSGEQQLDRITGQLDGSATGSEMASAKQHLQRLLLAQPGHLDARYLLARVYAAQGDTAGAFLHLQNLTERAPRHSASWADLAALRYDDGALSQAEQALTRALEAGDKEPGSSSLLQRRASLRLKLGRLLSAQFDAQGLSADGGSEQLLVSVRSALAEFKASSPPQTRPPAPARESFWPSALSDPIGSVTAAMGREDWDAAREAIANLEQRYPASMLAPWLAGAVLFAQGDPQGAASQLQSAYRLAPRSHRVISSLTYAWSRAAGTAEAASRLMALAESDPHFSYLTALAADIYLEARDPAAAEAALKKSVAWQPDSADAHAALGKLYLRLEQPDHALVVIGAAAEFSGGDREMIWLHSRALAAAGNRSAAIDVLRDVPATDHQGRARLAELTMADAPAEALSLLEPVMLDAPADPSVQASIAWALHLNGAHEQALDWLRSAARADASNPGTVYRLGVVHNAIGNPKKARDSLRAALESGAPFEERLTALTLLRTLDSRR